MGFLSNLLGGGGGNQTVTTKIDVPAFLQPFLEQGAGTSSGALSQLSSLLGGNLVSPFSQDQMAGFDLARQRAMGAGGFIPTAQQGLMNFAQGSPLSSFMPQSSFDALNSTAGGDFLFGGQGFNQAMDAAQRSIMPRVQSAFGSGGGVGGGTGGLAHEAMARALGDSFAGLYGQERANQLGAAGQLGSLASGERGRQLSALGALPGAAMLDVGILGDIGGQQQAQSQRELMGPITGQQMLLQSGLSGLPLSSMFGQTQNVPMQSNSMGNALGLGSLLFSLFGGGLGGGGSALGGIAGRGGSWG